MPGAGKSTVGVQLAKALGLDFVDTDLLIQSQEKRCLQDILDHDGYLALRAIEEQVLLDLSPKRTLVATGGSAIYSEAAMRHLQSLGTVIFLDVNLNDLHQRVNNESSRGIARPEGQTFEEVFTERTPLYQKYADVVFNNNPSSSIANLIKTLQK